MLLFKESLVYAHLWQSFT